MHIKLFSTLPSLNDYEVKFPRCHFNFQKLMRFLSILFGEICLFPVFNKSRRGGVNNCEKVSVLNLKTAFLMPSPL